MTEVDSIAYARAHKNAAKYSVLTLEPYHETSAALYVHPLVQTKEPVISDFVNSFS